MTRNPDLAAYVARDGRKKYVIATLSGFAPQTLSRLISGTVQPTKGQAEGLAEVLGVPVAQLFITGKS